MKVWVSIYVWICLGWGDWKMNFLDFSWEESLKKRNIAIRRLLLLRILEMSENFDCLRFSILPQDCELVLYQLKYSDCLVVCCFRRFHGEGDLVGCDVVVVFEAFGMLIHE